MKALVLVDIQNDFLPGGSLPVPAGDTIIPVINKIMNVFDLVVATQDWHPANHKSFASQHKGMKLFDEIQLKGLKQTLWPDHCVQGTYGAEISSQLNINRAEAIFRKGTDAEIDSYSAFYDNGHLKSTGLADYLRSKGIQEVYLSGLAGDICVYFTAMDSLKEGFNTYIIEDTIQPLSHAQFDTVMKTFVGNGGRRIKSDQLLLNN